MVQAWYMDCEDNDQRLPHHRNPPEYVSLDDVFKKTGVEYFKLNVNTYKTDGVLDKLKRERGYAYEDEMVCTKEGLPNFEEKIKSFYTEHLHADEEIRYFDVRDNLDQWIRIEVSAGDMVVIPSGIYHRFTLDTKNYIKTKRLFVDEPVWLPYNRPADDMECRKEYVNKLHKGFITVA